MGTEPKINNFSSATLQKGQPYSFRVIFIDKETTGLVMGMLRAGSLTAWAPLDPENEMTTFPATDLF